MCIFVFVGVKGGALVSVQRYYSQHGDPAIRSLLLHILSQVSGCGQGLFYFPLFKHTISYAFLEWAGLGGVLLSKDWDCYA